MKIEAIIVRELRMRLKAPFETSFATMCDRRILLVEVKSEGLSGWGEVTTTEAPLYNGETTDTAWSVLDGFIVPTLLGKSVEHAADVPSLLNSIRWHEMARAAVENALWDIEAQAKNVPLWQLLGGVRRQIDCGVSLGIQARTEQLLTNIGRELDAGYQRIKLKIKPGRDLEVLSAVRRQYPNIKLMADANSAYTFADLDTLRALDEFNLMMIEQPLQWDDIYEHSLLQSRLKTAICLDESIHNARHAAAAIALKACRIVNVKLGRVGGHSEARRLHDVCLDAGVPVWCGGMLESGVGRAHNIAMSTLPGFTLPGDVSASSRYWDQDIIDPPVEVAANGTISAPSDPGLGFTVDLGRVKKLTVRSQEWKHRVQVASDPVAPKL
jgi:O-succinylbenzoate synthase